MVPTNSPEPRRHLGSPLGLLAAIVLLAPTLAVLTRATADPATPDSTTVVVTAPVLEFAPGELWLDPISRNQAHPLSGPTGEHLALRNGTHRLVTVDLTVVPLAQSGDMICSGFLELTACAAVRLTTTRMRLAPGEVRAIPGWVRRGSERTRPGERRACVVVARPTDAALSPVFARLAMRGR